MLRALLFLFFCTCLLHAEDSPFRTKHVIILVVDGPRWSETWGEPQRQYIPVRNRILAPQGVLYMNMYNDGSTLTCPGHIALFTGFYQKTANDGTELPSNPTLSQYLLKSGKAAKNEAWIISSKDKLEVLNDSTSKGWEHQHLCSTDCGINGNGSGYRDDSITFENVKKVLTTDHPKLMIINLKDVDVYGHKKKWTEYLKAIQVSDRYIGEIWDLVQSDPILRDTTALFITNDHGRHLDQVKDGFTNHGDTCEGCMHIELLALGPDFKTGEVVTVRRGQIDLAVTAAHLLGLKLNGSEGQIMHELFKQPATEQATPTRN